MEDFYLYAREDAILIGGIQNGMIIAGHTLTIIKDSRFYAGGKVFRFYDKEKDCIDCGCAYKEVDSSGTLSCIRLEDEKVYY